MKSLRKTTKKLIPLLSDYNIKREKTGHLLLLIIFVLSVLNLIGWIFDISALKNFNLQGTTVKPVTAVSFILSVFALQLLQAGARVKSIFVRIPAFLITLAGVFTLINYAVAVTPGIESSTGNLHWAGIFLNQENRMAVITSILFILSGAVIVILSGNNPRAPGFAHVLTIPIFISGYFIPLGFLVGITSIASIDHTGVSIITGINFCLLSLVIFLFYPDTWFMKVFFEKFAGSNMARKLIPGIFFGSLIITWLRFNGEKSGLFTSETGIVLIGVTYTFFFLIMVWFVAKSANKIDEKRNEIKENLGKSENDYRQLVESANSIIIRLDRNGILRFVNDYAVKFFGYSEKEEMIGNDVSLIIPEKETSGRDLSNLFRDIVSKPRDYPVFDNENIKKNGEVVWISWANVPIFDQWGNVEEILSIGNDYTEHRRMEKEASEKALFVKTIAETVPDIISILDLHSGKLIYANRESPERHNFFDLLKMNPKERNQFLHPEDIVAFQNYSDTLRSAGNDDIVQLDYRYRTFRNNWKWYRARGKVFERDSTGKVKNCFIILQDITLEKDAEINLRQSEERFRTLVSASSESQYRMSPEWQEMYLLRNQGFLADTESPNPKWLEEYIPIEDQQVVKETISESIQNKSVFELEHRVRRADGSVGWVFSRAVPLLNEKGEIDEWFGAANDTTERKLFEEALRENEQRLQGIFDNAAIGIVEVNQEDIFISANKRICEILGYDREEILGKTVYDITSAEDLILSKDIYSRIHSGEVVVCDLDKRYIKKDGTIIWAHVSLSAIHDSKKNHSSTIGIIEDITERKQAVEDLRKSEEILKQAGMIASLGAWEIEFIRWDDINKNTLRWSDQTYRIFGYAPGSIPVTNDLFMEMINPDDREKLINAMTKAIDERANYRIEHRIIRTDGIERIVLENAEISYNPAGKPLRIIGTVQDITEQKLVEQKLMKAKEKAEESDRLKSAFIANLSHEIRTPMNGILGFAELLNTPNLSEESQKKYIEAISSSGKRMLDIIYDLISISKLEAGQMEIKIENVDINKVLDELFIFFLPEANKKGIMLKFNKELPPDKILIETDKTKLMQILTNLIKNALKFTSSGYVEFGCKLHGSYFLFYVSDTGIGVKKEFHEQIFERFRQGEVTPSGIYEGTGLGLSISKAYVELLGGTISVESEPAHGSVFSFTLPVKGSKETGSPLSIEDEKDTGAAFPIVEETLTCSTILIAEDEESIYYYLQQLLMLNNVGTLHARDGLEAIEIIKSNHNIDLILMDIKMPMMDGLEATRQIRAIKPIIPIIAQSAFNTEADIRNALEAGCNDYISKPFDREALLNKIARLCVP